MKTIFTTIIAGFLSFTAFSQVGIGTTNPNSSALVEIASASKGFLLPRVTLSQRNSITPTNGLQVYCTDCVWETMGELQIYNGTSWVNAAGAAASGVLTSLTSTQRNALEPLASEAGLSVWCTDCNAGAGEKSIFNGTEWRTTGGALANMAPPTGNIAICDGTRPTVVKDVFYVKNGITYTWMDRNLGASRAATSWQDDNSFGCLYQWGRGNDGHANINWTTLALSSSTSTQSATTNPGDNLFITGVSITDWMTSTPNPETRWQGVSGINNPCPAGYRVPTKNELEQTQLNSSIQSATVWLNATLKLPTLTKNRLSDGNLNDSISNGYYYSSQKFFFNFGLGGYAVYPSSNYANTTAIRCIKN